MRTRLFLLLPLAATVALTGCRGDLSSKPPIHPNLNMDFVERFEAQEANPLYADNSAQRQPVAGTVRRGALVTTDNAPVELGRNADGTFVDQIPVDVTPAMVARGQERFDIYCAVCHGIAGDAKGIMMTGNGGAGYGFQVPSYHTDPLRAQPDGYIYNVILNGINTMPSYGHTMPTQDRWAVVAYVRALQRSQQANPSDLPQTERDRLATQNPNVRN